MKKLAHIAIGLLVAGAMASAQTIVPVPYLSRISSGDTTPNFLFSKLVAGSGITLTKNNPGANETITITSTGSVASSTIWGMFSNTATGLTYDNTTGVTSLTSGYVIPLTASTSEWATAFGSTTALTPAYIRGLLSNTATGLSYDSASGITSLTAGYVIPLSASTTEWSAAYASTTALTPTYIKSQITGTYPIIVTSGVVSTAFSTSTVNSYSAQQTFVTASSTGLTSTNLYSTNLYTTNASTTGLTVSGQGFISTTTLTGNLVVNGGFLPRVVGYASGATTTINLDTTDIATTTISSTTTFANPTGVLYNGQMFELWGRATTTQVVLWGTQFASSTDLSNVSSVASGTTRWLFEYRQDSGKWELIGLLKTFVN